MDPRWGRQETPRTGSGRPGLWAYHWGGAPPSRWFPSHPSPSSLSSSFPPVGFISCGGNPEYEGLLGPVTQCPHPNTQGHCPTGKELASWL